MLSKNIVLTAHVQCTVKAAKVLLDGSGVLDLWQPGQNYFPCAHTGKLQILLKIYGEDKRGEKSNQSNKT